MDTHELLTAARDLLAHATPLKTNCGAYCNAACCQPDEAGNGGMLLFPGEEAFYTPAPAWAHLLPSSMRMGDYEPPLLVCNGVCPRAQRPLACRIFPLVIDWADGAPRVSPDVRAWPVCPLMPHGMQALDPGFVAHVRSAAALLGKDARCRAYLQALSAHLAAYKAL